MISSVKLADSYRSTRKWVMLFSWFSIFWASSVLNITKISIPYINEVSLSDTSIPIIALLLLIFMIVKMYNEFAMMPLKIRRNSLAIFDFKLSLYLSKLAILSLAVSIEVRSVKQVVSFLVALIPFSLIILSLGVVIGFCIILIGLYFRKQKRGLAFWVISMFQIGDVVAKISIIITIIIVALGLTFVDSVKIYFDISPSVLGVWTISIVVITLTIQQHFEGIYFNRLFGFEIYNPKTNVLKCYDRKGMLILEVKNYKN